MTITPAQFRSDFSEFADVSKFPDALVTSWLNYSQYLVNEDRWGSLTKLGQELCVAHFIVLAVRDRTTAAAGATPGLPVGLQTSKSVGDVSASYDYSALLVTDAGAWNQTSYGQRFYTLLGRMGAGGMQFLF